MIKNADIFNALQAQLLTVAGLPARAAPNVPFKPRLGDPYVRDTYMPIEPAVGSIGKDGFYFPQGLYQIDVMYPENVSTSLSKALAMADEIMSTFNRGVRLTVDGGVVQIDKSWAQVSRNVQGFYIIPVIVRWTAYGG